MVCKKYVLLEYFPTERQFMKISKDKTWIPTDNNVVLWVAIDKKINEVVDVSTSKPIKGIEFSVLQKEYENVIG